MGRRSRKRSHEVGQANGGSSGGRSQRDAARRARARAVAEDDASAKASCAPRAGRPAEERPQPLWGAFPLTELVTLAGIVLMVWGFFSEGGRNGNSKIAAGLAIASIAGLELAVREHVTGFRSHTTLLSGAVAIVVIVLLGLGAGLSTLGLLLVAGALAFGATFVGLRKLFKRRSGGLSFR
jgi:hypothetical protein